jgi:hypothetical protein
LYITKVIKTEKYVILFNGFEGFELSTGINGNSDPFVLDSPSMIDIGIMGHCFNNCKICYQGDISIPNMKFEDFKTIINQCKKHINQVALGGKGDPNKHEDFEKILQYCRVNNVVPNYTTSGNGLTDEEVYISKIYCGAVAVSNYNQDFTYNALNKFIEKKVKTNIHFVVSQETFDDAIKIMEGEDIWKKQFPIDKLNAVVFLLFKPQGCGADKKHLCLNEDQIKKFADLLLSPKCKFKVGCDSCMINKVRQVRELTKMETLCVDTCEAGRMSCYISPDMKFMPCSFGNKDIYGTQITEDLTIQKIWEHGLPFKIFRTVLLDKPSSCPYEL